MEKRLKKSKNERKLDAFTAASFFALAENAPDVICRFDRKYYHLYVNPAIEKVTGVAPSGFIGKSTAEVGMSPEFAEFWNTKIQQVFDTKEPLLFEFTFPMQDGMKYFQSSVVPEFAEDGSVVTVLSISRDITQIREQEAEKDAFLAMVTHELKTPLTSAKALTQVIGKRLSLADEVQNASYIHKVDTQLDRLTKRINDLLDATRLGAGKMQFQQQLFYFDELLEEIVGEVQETIQSHPIILEKALHIRVSADRDRLGQVLLNLLANAIKYSPDSLPVVVRIRLEREMLTCCVEDQGPGIPKELQGKLFQRFSRLSKKNHRDSPGLGLGLYISAQIIKQEGGTIWVDSDNGKKGTTFCFSLPVSS